ncbi:MAG TPA: hypothetical protein PK771_13065 [Spirochaetota bacterium]|nr:hypothetical protein [Spirochaetota bacterium]
MQYKSILTLLKKQPKSLRKRVEYVRLVDIYNGSDYLKKLKISNRAFTLLNKGQVNLDNISKFYQIFKLEKHIFFINFISLRNSYLTKKKSNKTEREKYIYEKMLTLPKHTKDMIRYLASIEKKIAKKNKTTLWRKLFYPTTKRKVERVLKYNNLDWTILFFEFIDEIIKKYQTTKLNNVLKKISLYAHEIYEEKTTFEIINKQFRILLKKYHPDTGGTNQYFIILKKCKDILVNDK